MNICIFGAASNEISSYYTDTTEQFGRMLAERGHNLVFGAGRLGIMGAAARGVKKGGGKVIGVIPTFFKEEDIEQIFLDCDELIYTDTMAERKSKMEELADAFAILPGGIGTFEEMFEVLTLKQLGRHTKPIAIYDINRYYKSLEELLHNSFKERFIRKDCRLLYECSDNPNKILDYIENDRPKGLSVHDLKNG